MTFLVGSIVFFLSVSVLLYVLLAGADFGAGILEGWITHTRKTPSSKAQLCLISQAIAPVWEANHVWLILVIVILFVGFPSLYTQMMTDLYLPMIAILIGIFGRGCAFTFRHYDTLNRDYYSIYSKVFYVMSLKIFFSFIFYLL